MNLPSSESRTGLRAVGDQQSADRGGEPDQPMQASDSSTAPVVRTQGCIRSRHHSILPREWKTDLCWVYRASAYWTDDACNAEGIERKCSFSRYWDYRVWYCFL